jgi:hypothetical protein
MPGKTRKARKGPTESASDFPEGTIKRGNDKQNWVVMKSRNLNFRIFEDTLIFNDENDEFYESDDSYECVYF